MMTETVEETKVMAAEEIMTLEGMLIGKFLFLIFGYQFSNIKKLILISLVNCQPIFLVRFIELLS